MQIGFFRCAGQWEIGGATGPIPDAGSLCFESLWESFVPGENKRRLRFLGFEWEQSSPVALLRARRAATGRGAAMKG